MDSTAAVCQVPSTLYYATLKADLEIVMRYCHQYAPGYIKWGCDATVYDGFPDFIFANNTDYPIKIVTYWNNNNVTVEILGTKVDDSYVEMVSETVDVIPWETVYEETDELAPGEKQEIQTPYTGYVVQTWRNVYAGGREPPLQHLRGHQQLREPGSDHPHRQGKAPEPVHTASKSGKEPHPQVRLFLMEA